ncbi:MAG TPA: MarR family transcriptional regulator [Thermomicrobiales bacterium]|jgi:DNA-binding MarR family transcriptional regulator|nr:MarR family transcriptional regulator [Thermomicrobiales bacterium]
MNEQLLAPSHLETWLAYQRMRVRLADRINRELSRETGVSEAEFEVLMALMEAPDEPMRALALRCGLEWEKSRLSHQLRRMEQRGLVRRDNCAEDNRGAVVVLTEEGRKLAAKARRVHDEAVRRYFIDVLSAEQVNALEDIARTVLDRLPTTQAT